MSVDPWRRISLAQGDITKLAVDAIVNAANAALVGRGGVDGAIHRAAGDKLMRAACAALGGCQPGDAKLTPGFQLPARFVIHAVGPIYQDGRQGEPETLASCYRRCLEVASQHHLTSIAFPAISTGVYRFPLAEATEIALSTVAACLRTSTAIHEAIFIFFSESDLAIANAIHGRLSKPADAD